MSLLNTKLDSVDWDAYHQKIIALTRTGIDAFVSKAPDAKVFQVGIWTDLEARVSVINFETALHGREYVESRVVELRDQKLYGRADDLEAAGRSTNPANFLYHDVAEVYHPELEPLRKHLGSSVKFNIADTILAEKLKAARAKILEEGLIAAVPHEDTVWFGISSQNSWYDNELAVDLSLKS